MNTSEVLYLAADLIEQRGWATGPASWEGVAGYCLEGALAAVLGARRDEDIVPDDAFYGCPAYVAVQSFLADRPLTEYTSMAQKNRELWGWNDRTGRTASEVVGVLRAAAVVEAARESQPAEQVTA